MKSTPGNDRAEPAIRVRAGDGDLGCAAEPGKRTFGSR
jgi:hypothetical protein